MLYKLPEDMSDSEVIQHMWQRNGATEEDPTPFLRTALCRVVSLVVLERHKRDENDVRLRLHSFPDDPENEEKCAEPHIFLSFLGGVGSYQPQVVGFNSDNSDLKIVIQRGLANGIQAKEYCTRPEKPWQGNDYFARGQDCNIDLMEIVGGFGRTYGVSLNEIAVVCGIPGKLGTSGDDVAGMWMNGQLKEIVQYNQYDAFTTYLLWLRLAHFAGLFTSQQYADEQVRVEEYLDQLINNGASDHLIVYLDEWRRLRSFRTSSLS
jgi:hypothetical protein